MKNKTSLLLMEQLIMVLVFALAAALCLNVFAGADRISRETARRDRAVLLAQNAAEVLKATSGDEAYTMDMLESAAAAEGFRLEIDVKDSGSAYLGTAEIRIWQGDAVLFALDAGWQEDGP